MREIGLDRQRDRKREGMKMSESVSERNGARE